MSEIWVISEQTGTILELIAHAKGLSPDERIVAWTFSPEVAELAASHGADLVKQLTGGSRPEAWIDTIIAQAQAAKPSTILLGTSKRAKGIAARVAAALDTGLITECISVERKEEFISQRYIYGGLCVATEETSSIPFMATMAVKMVEPLSEVSAVEIEVLEGAKEVCKVIELRENQATSNLSEANVVVCVGRGITKEEDIEMANRLAKALGGEVGCTRPIAEDLHWMPEENYIGISGQVVKPTVYIGLGVSGQIQHLAGIRDSKTIIAIEKNENAPIIEAADYALVGDLYEILPALLNAINA